MESNRQDINEVPRMKLLEVGKSNNQFAIDLYANLRAKKGNLFFSPASVITALAMVYAGARGQTETELKDVLHLTLPQEELHTVFAKWISRLITDANQNGNQLRIANALWGRKGDKFLPSFLELLATKYNSELRETDFNLPTEAANQINGWVARQTENRITQVVNPALFDSLTRLVLANAIYFKGKWESPFSKDETRNAPFTLEDDAASEKTVSVSMMTIEKNFIYSEGDNFQAVELPYIGDDFSIIIFLPRKETISGFKKLFRKAENENLLQKFEETFTYERFTQWRPKRSELVEVFLPKFKMSSDFQLSSTLRQLGMQDAFSPDNADFSGISKEEPLNISEVLHKAWVEVNEEGTEAAAATVVVVLIASASLLPTKPPTPIIFRADHPFLFLICRKYSNDILFMGSVMNPLES